MSIEGDARRLLDLSTNTVAAAGVREAIVQVKSSTEIACAAAGQGSSDARQLFEMAQAAEVACQTAIAAIQLFYDTCGTVAARHM